MLKTIEICCDSISSCITAQRANADRVEICSALNLGGLTPSYGTILEAKKELKIDINILIRPRQGNFYYSKNEILVMQKDIDLCGQIGVNGVVFGALDKYGNVDIETNRLLIQTAKNQGLSVTFHRAIDMSADMFKSLETVIELGADRILTSGGCKTALEGIKTIAEMQKIAENRIKIMPAAGINSDNIVEIVQKTGVEEIHFSGSKIIESEALFRKKILSFTPECLGGDYQIQTASFEKIEKSIYVLHKFEKNF